MSIYTRIATAALRQIPFDFAGNRARILDAIEQAAEAQTNVLLLPELALTGYGCEDNFTFQAFHEQVESSINAVVEVLQATSKSYNKLVVAMGLPLLFPGGQVYNATAVMSARGLHCFVCKQFLARNGLHYEPRWFAAWKRGKVVNHPAFGVPMGDIVIDVEGIRIGYETCEDAWISNRPGRDLYQRNVDVMLNPSASHFAVGKYSIREQLVEEGSRAFGVAYAYANLSGTENGTSIFDAGCMIASEGKIVSRGDRLNVSDTLLNHTLVNISANRAHRIVSSETIANEGENTVFVPINITVSEENLSYCQHRQNNPGASHEQPHFWNRLSPEELRYSEICYAIGNGLWDWMNRTKTNGFIVSLSGGADSALVATLVFLSNVIAVEQLGVQRYVNKLPVSVRRQVEMPKKEEPVLSWLRTEILPRLLICLYQSTANSSQTTLHAAQQVADDVGARFHHWDLESLVQQYTGLVNDLYPDDELNWQRDDVTLQNIQARTRSPGVWMLANRENKLLLATSNLSESALGYATMDGDTSGVLSAISGLSKTTIRSLLRWLEQSGLPLSNKQALNTVNLLSLKWINCQQPTAELRPDAQTDEDDLMPYDICDFIMSCYLTKQMWPKSILQEFLLKGVGTEYEPRVLAGFIDRWFRLFCRNPWKRYGIRAGFHVEQISLDPKSFHRFPLLNSGFEEPLQLMWDFVKKKEKLNYGKTTHQSLQISQFCTASSA